MIPIVSSHLRKQHVKMRKIKAENIYKNVQRVSLNDFGYHSAYENKITLKWQRRKE